MKIRRPVCLVSLVFILLIMGCVYITPDAARTRQGCMPAEREEIILTGVVKNKEYRVMYGSKVPVLYISNIEDEGRPDEKQNGEKEKTLEKCLGEKGLWHKNSTVICYMTKAGDSRNIPAIEEKVRISGKVSLFREATNPGEFNLRDYYQILNISYKVNQAEILARSGSGSLFKERLFQLKCRCADALDEIYPAKEASILKAMLLGEKSSLDEEMKELYQLNGLIHILSISGLHISLLGMALYGLMKKCFVPLGVRVPVTVAAMWCYGTMTGMGVSTWRAVFMFALHLAAELFGRTYDMLTALALAAVLMLMERPLLVCHSGFLLSFGAVLGIVVLLPWWKEITERLFIGKALQGKPPDGKNVKGLLYKTWEAMNLSMAIAITTLPILLYFYFTYPIYSLILNLFVLPLMGFVLADGILSMGIGLFLPGIAVYLGIPDRLVLWFYETLCEGVLKLPGSILIGGRPAGWQIVIYYGVLALLVTGRNLAEEGVGMIPAKRRRYGQASKQAGRETGGGFLPPLCQWFLMLGMVWLLLLRPVRGVTAYFLDVGQGDCIVMVNENGSCYMVDGGSTDKSRVGKYQMLPFLESKGIGELEAVFLTHPDEDHISGVLELMEQSGYGIRIKMLVLPDVAEEMKREQLLEVRQAAASSSIPVYYISSGDVLQDKNLLFYCLGPQEGFKTDEVNEISTVLSVSYGDFSMLLTGDVTGEPEKETLTEWENMSPASGTALKKLTVLKVAHHGSRFSTPEDLLEVTDPVYAVISAGRDNRYGHPHEELMERLQKAGCRIYTTQESGAIWFWTDGKRVKAGEFCHRRQ